MATKKSPDQRKLLGLVHPRGCAAICNRRTWTGRVDLIAWREDDGPVQLSPLSCELARLTERASNFFPQRLVPWSHVQLIGHFLESTTPQFKLLKRPTLLKSDKQLAAAEKSLKKPVHIRDKFLGRLTLDRASHELRGQVRFGQRRIKLSIALTTEFDPQNLDKNLAHARAALKDHARWTRQMSAYLVKKVLPLANDWEQQLDEPGPPITPAKFLAKVKPESLHVDHSGLTFGFNDADYFAGHLIMLFTNPKRTSIRSFDLWG